MASFFEDLIEVRNELVCQICEDPPRPGKKQWYRCMKLHQICQDCKVQNENCTCGDPLSTDYCRMTEKLLSIKRMKLNCVNLKNGCQEAMAESDLEEHELECVYRSVPCLGHSVGMIEACEEKVTFQNVIAHYEEKANLELEVGELNTSGIQVCDELFVSGQNCFRHPIKFFKDDHTFLLAQKTVDKVVYNWVYFYGSTKKAENFNFTLKIYGSKATTRFEGKVASIEESFETLRKSGKCFMLVHEAVTSQILDEYQRYEGLLEIRNLKEEVEEDRIITLKEDQYDTESPGSDNAR